MQNRSGDAESTWEFGKSRHSEVSNKVMQYLYTAHMPVTVKQLFKLISNDLNKPSEMTDIIENFAKSREDSMDRWGEEGRGRIFG